MTANGLVGVAFIRPPLATRLPPPQRVKRGAKAPSGLNLRAGGARVSRGGSGGVARGRGEASRATQASPRRASPERSPPARRSGDNAGTRARGSPTRPARHSGAESGGGPPD